MKIGLFGGSFDPIHVGHLWIAEAAREQLGLDEIRWIPAAQSPLKKSAPVATDEQRLMMIRLSISGLRGHEIDDRELRRGNISYTLDTLREICEEDSRNEYFFILGADSLASMSRWHQPEEIANLVTLAVVARGGEQKPNYSVLSDIFDDERVRQIRNSEVTVPMIEISSSEIRERIKHGLSIRYRVPLAVEAFLRSEKLYTA